MAAAALAVLVAAIGLGVEGGDLVCSCELIGCSLGLALGATANSSGFDRRCAPACMLPSADDGMRDVGVESGCCPDFAAVCAPPLIPTDGTDRHDFAGKRVNTGTGDAVPRHAFKASIASAPARVVWPTHNGEVAVDRQNALLSVQVDVRDYADADTASPPPQADVKQHPSLEETLPTPSPRVLLVVVTMQGGWSPSPRPSNPMPTLA